ncbi:MAG: MinD/ParA family protein, partial [Nanoarchaeota archaeon]|nr:MinD/ParA family protein [Nanoarchaeota archaeon]
MTRFIALISGKGGVGKTTLTLALARSLSKLGKRVLVLDANFETPNLALHLGLLQPKATLNQFLNKEKALQNIIHEHEDCQFAIIPTSPALSDCRGNSSQNLSKIFDHLENTYDFVLVDCPSGMGEKVS